MTWAKLHDGFDCDDKIVSVSNASVGVFAKMLSYCARNLTDGAVRETAAKSIGATRKLLNELVVVGLVTKSDTGYAVANYLKYNPTREQVLADRESAKERQQRSRGQPPGTVRHSVTGGVTNGVTHTVGHSVSHNSSHRTPVPSRPEGEEEGESVRVHTGAKDAGSPSPNFWKLTEAEAERLGAVERCANEGQDGPTDGPVWKNTGQLWQRKALAAELVRRKLSVEDCENLGEYLGIGDGAGDFDSIHFGPDFFVFGTKTQPEFNRLDKALRLMDKWLDTEDQPKPTPKLSVVPKRETPVATKPPPGLFRPKPRPLATARLPEGEPEQALPPTTSGTDTDDGTGLDGDPSREGVCR